MRQPRLPARLLMDAKFLKASCLRPLLESAGPFRKKSTKLKGLMQTKRQREEGTHLNRAYHREQEKLWGLMAMKMRGLRDLKID